MELLKSASKIVFLILTLSACAGFFLGLLDPKDFMILAGMAFSFYFANKGDENQPYAGK
jgi:asparagine N-glycosylation enzyme membrane subunit Stt3